MGTRWGNLGEVKFSSNNVANIIEFEFTEKVEPIDDTAMGDAYKTHIAASGIKEWSGSLTCHWDDTDTNGQVAATVGASVTLNMYPAGDGASAVYWTGTATITERGQTTKMDGETIRVTFSFVGSGVLTRTAV